MIKKFAMLTLVAGMLLVQNPAQAGVLSDVTGAAKSAANKVVAVVTRVATNTVNAGKAVINGVADTVKGTVGELTK